MENFEQTELRETIIDLCISFISFPMICNYVEKVLILVLYFEKSLI